MLATAQRHGHPWRGGDESAIRNLPALHATIFRLADLADAADQAPAIVFQPGCAAGARVDDDGRYDLGVGLAAVDGPQPSSDPGGDPAAGRAHIRACRLDHA